ncbi:MAG: homocysteine methyltransferase [Deltaproteobacteria bacterium]|jgi:S-methylmethionine-dependent homocysteine/selenocysteine methylase|nr:homocysteine methyltransferase [Deltaproteobacteria bacterium]
MAAEHNRRPAPPGDAATPFHLDPRRPFVLDGATGTELERRGVPCALPLWSTHGLLEAPDLVRSIHSDYARAGCDGITANTFRTQRRVLDRAGLGHRARELTGLAVRLAREAHPGGVVFGSAPPLEDCYHPERVPGDPELDTEHAEHARHLAETGVDAILVETHNTVREAVAAATAASASGSAFLVGFACDDSARLLSGEPLADGIAAVEPLRPVAVGVNCLPPRAVAPCLRALARCGLPFFVSANLGAPDARGEGRNDELSPRAFAEQASLWLDAGAALVGGCCGTTPDHLAALVGALREPASA